MNLCSRGEIQHAQASRTNATGLAPILIYLFCDPCRRHSNPSLLIAPLHFPAPVVEEEERSFQRELRKRDETQGELGCLLDLSHSRNYISRYNNASNLEDVWANINSELNIEWKRDGRYIGLQTRPDAALLNCKPEQSPNLSWAWKVADLIGI